MPGSKYKPVKARKPDVEAGDATSGDSSQASTGEMRLVSPAPPTAAHPPILTAEQKEELGGYEFPFDAIVIEGGGNKGLSTTGVIRISMEKADASPHGSIGLVIGQLS